MELPTDPQIILGCQFSDYFKKKYPDELLLDNEQEVIDVFVAWLIDNYDLVRKE
jgi:hypothetical protein